MIYHQGERFTLYHGDNRAILPTLAENSVDAIVTDPPYELGFMGKSWDASGVAFDPATWREAMRVLKPGGYLLAFSGSRTYHRIAVAIEDAGFEIRDQIMWLYGSGFPKSLNIAKSIDKSNGFQGEVIGKGTSWNRPDSEEGDVARMNTSPGEYDIRELSEQAKQWQGWGTALKPAHEPIVVARKPLIGTVAANVLTYGTGGLNIDGARVGNEGGGTNCTNRDEDGNCVGHDNAGRSTSGATIHAAESNGGRWPANVIHDGSDEVVAGFPITAGNHGGRVATSKFEFGAGNGSKISATNAKQDSGSAARFFYCAKASKRDRNEGLEGFEAKLKPYGNREEWQIPENGDVKGSVNDKFTTQPQANHHPTVKPTDLMRYLCRLVTPKGGIVLDPFTGSGSTGKAAIYEGFNFIGIEMTDEYLPIAKARIEFATNDREETLFDA